MLTEIAGYRIIRLIREGNFGTFYAATPPARLGLGEAEVILKVMLGSASDDEFRRFANELKIFSSLRSPHLATLHEAGSVGDSLYYAMEAFPGGSLERPQHQLSIAERAGAVAAAARGAHDLHEGGIVHRDIKPANILLTDPSTGSGQGSAKLADLGLAHIVTPGQTFTGHGPIGAVEFTDPALVRGESGSRDTDVWSLAVSLHWALAGRGVYGPIPTRNIVEALRHVLTTPPMLSPELPPQWRPLVERCLVGEPEGRPRTAAALAAAIEEVAARS